MRNTTGEAIWPQSYPSLSHSKWKCNYHLVFIPTRRRPALFGQISKHLGAIFHDLAAQKGCRIIEGHLMPASGSKKSRMQDSSEA